MKSLIADRDAMVRVCRLYYFEEKTQNEIAKTLGISRPQVSRLLSRAKEEGILKIEIDPGTMVHSEEIADALKQKCHLNHVVVSDVDPNGDVIRSLGFSAARFLSGYLKDNQLIGISWGRTLYETVERIVFNGELPNTTFVPLIGGVGQIRHEYQMNSIVEKIANAFRSKRYYLYAPAHMKHAKTLQMMLEDDAISLVVEMWKKLDLAIVGIGEPISLSNTFRDIYDPDFFSFLLKQTAIGDIAARFFTKDGAPCASADESILGISLSQLKQVPKVIGIAGGKEKTDAIYTAIKTGYINSLVTDKHTAIRILEREC